MSTRPCALFTPDSLTRCCERNDSNYTGDDDDDDAYTHNMCTQCARISLLLVIRGVTKRLFLLIAFFITHSHIHTYTNLTKTIYFVFHTFVIFT